MQKLEASPSVSRSTVVNDFSAEEPAGELEHLSFTLTTDQPDVHCRNSLRSRHAVRVEPEPSAEPAGSSETKEPNATSSNQGLSLPLSPQTQTGDRTPGDRQTTQVFKVIILGDSGVGKTCLTYRLCMGTFLQKGNSTVGVDFRKKTIQVGSQLVKLQLWDTAGQERFRRSMVPHYYRNVHAVVYVYDINNVVTFDNLTSWMAECDQYCTVGRIIAKVLVGNKCDAASHPASVPTHVAQRFADLHAMSLFETSAKDDAKSDHVESIFVSLIYDLVAARRSGFSTPADERKQHLIELRPGPLMQRQDQCSC